MTVAELIAALSTLPPAARVLMAYDGAARNDVDFVWLARSGEVVLAEAGEYLDNTDDRPAEAPTADVERYWCPPGSSALLRDE